MSISCTSQWSTCRAGRALTGTRAHEGYLPRDVGGLLEVRPASAGGSRPQTPVGVRARRKTFEIERAYRALCRYLGEPWRTLENLGEPWRTLENPGEPWRTV